MANQMGISYAAAVKRQARDNHKKAAEVARTNAAATATTKEAMNERSTEMIESRIITKETATTTAGKRYREESDNSQQQPTKINRKGAMQFESSSDSSDDEGRLVIDETPAAENSLKPSNKKALADTRDAEFEQLRKKTDKMLEIIQGLSATFLAVVSIIERCQKITQPGKHTH